MGGTGENCKNAVFLHFGLAGWNGAGVIGDAGASKWDETFEEKADVQALMGKIPQSFPEKKKRNTLPTPRSLIWDMIDDEPDYYGDIGLVISRLDVQQGDINRCGEELEWIAPRWTVWHPEFGLSNIHIPSCQFFTGWRRKSAQGLEVDSNGSAGFG